jgi:lysophospholipase L1-like esterase
LVAGAILGALIVPLASLIESSAAGATTPTSAFYLDIGGSGSVGVQPTPADPHGQPTSSGYANLLVALEAANGLTLQLSQIGCPGETVALAINGGDSCYSAPSSQLTAAVAYLGQHTNDSVLVTIDLGFNNIVPCLKRSSGVTSCVNQGIAAVRLELPQFLQSLQAAAGPNVSFVGVGHYDPFLASARSGLAGRAKAATSLRAVELLNRTLSDVYRANSIPMANVAQAFGLHVTTPVVLDGSGTVPTNVANACLMTWMCVPPPFGPNLHPNDVGYRAIANAIAAKVSLIS